MHDFPHAEVFFSFMSLPRPQHLLRCVWLCCCLLLPFGQAVLAQPQASAKPAASLQQSSTIKTIYIIPSSHWDLGFLAPPEDILPRLKPHIDEVIANAKADPEFRWTIESAWQVREWLARTSDPQKIQEFAALVNKGQIQLSAVWGSMHTEFMGNEQMNRLLYDMKAIERQLGVHTNLAMMDDVPGFSLRLPQVLARSGVRYFVTGSNTFLAGGTSLTPGKVPFQWESPDGSRVLTWQTQGRLGGYTEAMADYLLDPESLEPYTKEHFYPKELEGHPRLEIMQHGVDKLLAKYRESGYTHDALMVLYLHDFISSNREAHQLLPAVREWNAAGRQPRIVVATPAEFFQHLEGSNQASSSSGQFPIYGGDWNGLWSEVKTNSPVISAQARWINDHLPVAELLWSLLTFRNFTSVPSGNLEEARQKLLKYEEHSGAAQIGWPKLMSRAEVEAQNRQYVEYTSTGKADIEYLLHSGVRTLLSQKPGHSSTIVVFNPLSWQRTDVAQLKMPATANGKIISLRDLGTGAIVPLQKVSEGEVVFLAKDVPALGYRTYEVVADDSVVGDSKTRAMGSTLEASPILEDENYRITLRIEDGSIAGIFDKRLQQELVNSKKDNAANQLLRWTFAENLPVGLAKVQITKDAGEVFSRLTVRRPGSFWPETQITLYHGMNRIEILNFLDREKMPFVASNQAGEYYSFQFPFRFQGSASVKIEDGLGYHDIPDQYLPGARTDAAAPLHSLVLSGNIANRSTNITLSQRESFFDYLPGMPAVKGPNTFLNVVRATVMHKQDQGDTRDLGMVNFATVEPGLPSISSYQFSIRADAGALDPVISFREGTAENVPLIAEALPSAMQPASSLGSFFSLSANNVVLLAFKPSEDGNPEHYTMRLQEIAGQVTELEVHSALKPSAAEAISLTEDQTIAPIAINPLKLKVGPHETVTLRLTIPHPHKERSTRWWEW